MGQGDYETNLTLLAASHIGFFRLIQFLVVKDPGSLSQELGKHKEFYYCATN